MPKTQILVIEDDRSLAEVLEYNLVGAGYEVFCAHDGLDGINQARAKSPDMIILDLMIPVIDGIETCRQLRSESRTRDTPIMMLTAKSEETDQLIGFSVGADDYVVKPFSVRIVLERVKSLLRRNSRSDSLGSDIVVSGKVTVDRVKHRVSIDGSPIDLTPSEFRLLDTLIRQPGRAFDRSELIDSALGEDTLVLERTIDVHIRSLRKKLGTHSNAVETVRGIGYRFRDTQTDESES
jgi:two-component system phosphate regulon response regulator PhoB